MESSFKKVRLIHWVLLASIPLLAGVAEIGRSAGSNAWTWRHWCVAGLCCWGIAGVVRLRSRLMKQSKEKLAKNGADAKGIRQWEVGQIVTFAGAEGVAWWGLLVRMVFCGALWQASLFYMVGFSLLLLWTPRLPHKPVTI